MTSRLGEDAGGVRPGHERIDLLTVSVEPEHVRVLGGGHRLDMTIAIAVSITSRTPGSPIATASAAAGGSRVVGLSPAIVRGRPIARITLLVGTRRRQLVQPLDGSG